MIIGLVGNAKNGWDDEFAGGVFATFSIGL
jgi:hypothetical protein